MELGFHIGLVVQNNDPEMRGRVKVYIPELSPNIPSITDKMKEGIIFAFKCIDKEYSPEIASAIQEIKNNLPWAEQAAPLFGGNAPGRYNATTNRTTNSDTNTWDATGPKAGFRMSNNWLGENTPHDAWEKDNPFSKEYMPSNFSGMARGVFSIPNVGAQVYVFFLANDVMHPVYFASSYGDAEFKRIYTRSENSDDETTMHYPALYENVPVNPSTEMDKTFRSQSVINSNKNSIELIDTDQSEAIKITHYSGSFKEFGNDVAVEFDTANDQKMVMGDQFLTIRGRKFENIGDDDKTVHTGDSYEIYGTTNSEYVKNILDLHSKISEYKMLFPVKRVSKELSPGMVSPLQTSEPYVGSPRGYSICPLCSGEIYDTDTSKAKVEDDWKMFPILEDGIFTERGYAYSSENPCLPSNSHTHYGEQGIYGGTECPVCNNKMWKDLSGTGWAEESEIGFSPSTENGMWAVEDKLIPGGEADNKVLSLVEQITQNELAMGPGGDKIEKITMSKIETIGLAFNSMPSIRIDPIGKLRVDGVFLTQEACVDYSLPTPLVELVDVTDIPGGDYDLTVGNKFNLRVGSVGINMQTTGPIFESGTVVDLASEELNLVSKSDTYIDGGERVMVRGRKITLNPYEHNAVCVEGQLHVTRNSIIHGGMYVDGEFYMQHVTAPLEWHMTECGEWDAILGALPETASSAAYLASLSKGDREKLQAFGKSDAGMNHNKCSECGQQFNSSSEYIEHKLKEHRESFIAASKGEEFMEEEELECPESVFQEVCSVCEIPALFETEAMTMFGTLFIPGHRHHYADIPMTLTDSPNHLRFEAIENGINDRAIIAKHSIIHNQGVFERADDSIYSKNEREVKRAVENTLMSSGYAIYPRTFEFKSVWANGSGYDFVFSTGAYGVYLASGETDTNAKAYSYVVVSAKGEETEERELKLSVPRRGKFWRPDAIARKYPEE